ncbi:helix-turn-helix domain-containing protein [Lewinella sp. LCG006]|uniref:helix-turn-helix domain-containing protein n=1 Tax=Lewinella sp. LCG006 TaxID=3231911 RepID=UPI00345F4ABD
MMTTATTTAINWESEAVLSQIADQIHKPLAEIIRLTRYIQTKQEDTETSRLSAIMLESSEQLESLVEAILQAERQKQIQIVVHHKFRYPKLYCFDTEAVQRPQDSLDNPESYSENRISKADLEWLMQLERTVADHLDDAMLCVPWLADELAVSERQLFRKVEKYTGLTPNKYVRKLKLHHAKALLESYTYSTISEVAGAVGMKDPHYFSKLFKEEFGIKPMEYFHA